MVLKMVLNMVLSTVLIMVLNMGLDMVLNIGYEHELKSEHQFYFLEAIHYLQFLYYQFFSRLVLDFMLMSSFFRVNVSNSNKISEYSSSEM